MPGLPYGAPANHTEQAPKKRNVLGIIALSIAIIGAIFACVPGALIVGWVLLPFGFILGLVALFISGTSKRSAIAAVLVSVLGTIVGFLVFIVVVDDAVSSAFESDVTVSSPSGEDSGQVSAPLFGNPESATGTRANPAALGDTLSTDDWDIVVTSFTRNATAEVMAENPFNDAPPAGSQYALVTLTVTYTGNESGLADFISAAWVTESGNVITSYDNLAVAPDSLGGELYTGATASGNIVIAVPDGDSGLLRVDPGFIDEVFVKVE